MSDVEKLTKGTGTLSVLGEEVFDDYWIGYYNKQDAKTEGIGKPPYHNIDTYRKYLMRKNRLLKKLNPGQ